MRRQFKISMDEVELKLMLGSYLRYSLGRSSYIVSACIDTIEELSKHLSAIDVERFVIEITTQLAEAEDRYQTLGSRIDHESWEECAYELSKQLKERDND